MKYKYLFGPVPSRRLGISLGVDLIPHKICSMDCVYCECGATTQLTMERAEYVPTPEVIAELDHFFSSHPVPDVVTFSGSGEPTLHVGIGSVIQHVRSSWKVPVAVITNATLLWDPEVRSSLLEANLLLPSLDAVGKDALSSINRPHVDMVETDYLVRGLEIMRQEFQGEMWLEIFVLPPFNTSDEELDRLQKAIDRICPDRVQLNALDRPPVETWVKKASPADLESVRSRLRHPHIEIISRCRRREDVFHGFRSDVAMTLSNVLSRRPLTLDDLVALLGLRHAEIGQYLDVLETEGRIKAEIQDARIFYRCIR